MPHPIFAHRKVPGHKIQREIDIQSLGTGDFGMAGQMNLGDTPRILSKTIVDNGALDITKLSLAPNRTFHLVKGDTVFVSIPKNLGVNILRSSRNRGRSYLLSRGIDDFDVSFKRTGEVNKSLKDLADTYKRESNEKKHQCTADEPTVQNTVLNEST